MPVSWTADDDEALRSFDVQVSYDGGRGWHFVARELPDAARSYRWRLPASEGVDDVRLRVVARDRRFQTSASTSGPFAVSAGSPGPGDADGDGDVDLEDHAAFTECMTGPDRSGVSPTCRPFNLDGDRDIDLADFRLLQVVFAAQGGGFD